MRNGTKDDQPLRFPGQERLFDGSTGTEERYNIFRWYRSGWGKYTQADPVGLRGGTNLYGYVNDNPLEGTDPFGLWEYIGETNKYIQGICADPNALGCTKVKSVVRCDCAGGCNAKTRREGWYANASVRFDSLRIYFSTDCYDPGKIIMEEERHAAVYDNSMREARARAGELDRRRFNSKSECEEACRGFVADLKEIMERPIHGWIDFTHPNRRCDGSFAWR
jgi:RHS repeat-associated protein